MPHRRHVAIAALEESSGRVRCCLSCLPTAGPFVMLLPPLLQLLPLCRTLRPPSLQQQAGIGKAFLEHAANVCKAVCSHACSNAALLFRICSSRAGCERHPSVYQQVLHGVGGGWVQARERRAAAAGCKLPKRQFRAASE